jgi:hypothetical protein
MQANTLHHGNEMKTMVYTVQLSAFASAIERPRQPMSPETCLCWAVEELKEVRGELRISLREVSE